MKNLKILVYLTILLPVFYACDFVSNIFTYKDSTAEFINSIIKEDYDKTIDCIDNSSFADGNISTDSIKMRLADFRKYLVNGFGTEIEYSFINAQKRKSTIESDNTPSGTTEVFIQINNKEYFGMLELLFKDDSGKIIKADVLNIKERIPTMSIFWLVGLIAICVPVFNIYMIVRVYRSSLKKKWLKYLAIIFLNLPTIVYTLLGSLYFDFFKMQILFGISFSFSGYAYSFWAVGIPLGGIYWYWRLAVRERLEKEEIGLDNDISTTEDVYKAD